MTGNPSVRNQIVVVPLDGSEVSERTLPLARAFLPPGGELVLVRIIPPVNTLTELAVRDVLTPAELDGVMREDAQRELDVIATRLRGGDDAGISARAIVAEGDPAPEIVRIGAELEAGLIAMATHGRGALGRLTYGSVADAVARTTTVPVLLGRIHDGDDGGGSDAAAVRRLVIPFDGSEVAAVALPIAADYARVLGVPILLVRAVSPAGDVPVTFGASGGSGGAAEMMLYEQVREEDEAAAAQSLAAVAEQLKRDGVTVTTRVDVGPAVSMIAGLIEPGDVIVMTSHGRSGIGRWLLGSVAEKLVREGSAPVLLVPAAGREVG